MKDFITMAQKSNNTRQYQPQPRLKTIKETLKALKELDPETAVSEYFIRQLCKEHKIHYLTAGKKILVNFDSFLDYLQGGNY